VSMTQITHEDWTVTLVTKPARIKIETKEGEIWIPFTFIDSLARMLYTIRDLAIPSSVKDR